MPPKNKNLALKNTLIIMIHNFFIAYQECKSAFL